MQLNFSDNHVLENNRVRLEPLESAHFGLLQHVAAEEGIWKYFLGRSNGYKDFEYYIDDAINYRKKESEYSFAIYDKKLKKYAGSTRFFEYSSDLEVIRLGYSFIGKEFQRTGLNTNCKYLLFEFAFEQLKVERVGLGAHAENTVSIAAMKSVGCTQEGTIRNLFPAIDGQGRSDAILLGLLKNEWVDTIKQNLKLRL